MSILLTQAQKLSLPALTLGAMQEIVTVDEVFAYLPFQDIAPNFYNRYNQELTLGTATYATSVAPSGSWSESAPTWTQVEDSLKVFGDSVYVPKIHVNDANVVASNVAAKAKVVGRGWSRAFITGSGTVDQIKGLRAHVSGSSREEAVHANGSGSLTLAKMDTLLSKVDAGRPSMIVMNTTQKNTLIGLIRAAGSLPNFVTNPNLGAGAVLTYNGVPVLVNDFITQNDDFTGSRVYAAYASELDGMTGFYNGGNLLSVEDPIPVNQSDMVEIKVIMRAGFSLKSTHAIYSIYGCL